jgi:quinol monooxygenase YgiN
MQGFGLIVRHVVKLGHEDAFDQLVAGVINHINRHELGTLVYSSHSVTGDTSARVFYELYRDRAAFEFHEQQDYVRAFLTAREDHVESVQVDYVTALAGLAGRDQATPR